MFIKFYKPKPNFLFRQTHSQLLTFNMTNFMNFVVPLHLESSDL